MYITKAEEYGICGAVYLANKSPHEVTPLSEVSRAQAVPEKFLAKIFQQMARAGILISHRGVKGGYSLARPASEIKLSEVIGLFHHDTNGTGRMIPETGCQSKAGLADVIDEARRVSDAVYQKYSLAQLIPVETEEIEMPV